MGGRNPDPRAGRKPPFREHEQPTPGAEGRMDTPPDFGEATYKGLGRLRDRVALVTGADSGIGRAVALAYAREGADVVVSYLSEHEDAQVTKDLVERAGRRAMTLAGDLGADGHCGRLVRETVERFGKLDILVNNAAYQGEAVEAFEQLTAERVERTFRTNIVAMLNLTRHALPHLKPGAVIINTTSIQAYHPKAYILDYASTKAAIKAFTEGLAQELTARGIRVNAVAPGPVWTPLVVQSFPSEKLERFGADTPLGRPAQPAEIAPLYVFLASDESRYVSGEILGATGGRLLG